MVYDSFSSSGTTPTGSHNEEKRSLESRQMSYQKMQEPSAENRKRERELSTSEGGNKNTRTRDTWTSIFKSRQHFNNMHFC